MPALENGTADFGVCIHEGRFTWQESQLGCVADLGTMWENETGSALPLGGLLGRRDLGSETLKEINRLIRDSIEYGMAHRDETLPTMRQYAQEFSDEGLLSHVDLYVNEWTIDLGETGRQALQQLAIKAEKAGIQSPDASPLEIL